MDYKPVNINRIMVTGRLCKDVELKRTPAGTSAMFNTVANDRNYKDKDGSWQKETTFIDFQAYGIAAESLEKFAKKGMSVMIEGRLTKKEWEDKDGNAKSAWVITADQVHILEWLPKEETKEPAPATNTKDDVPF
jgi:single-strand DNA-binding protein